MHAFAAVYFFGVNAYAGKAIPAESGREIAEMHCTRCHVLPDPSDISKEIWPLLLVRMGEYFGFMGDELPDFVSIEVREGYANHTSSKTGIDVQGREYTIDAYKAFVPPQPLISEADWLAIRNYYVNNALPMVKMYLPEPQHPVLEGFTASTLNLDLEPNGLITALAVDEPKQLLYVGRDNAALTGDPLTVILGEPPQDFNPEATQDLIVFDLKTGKRVGHTVLGKDNSLPTDISVTDKGHVRVGVHGEWPLLLDEYGRAGGAGQATITDWTGLTTGEPRKRTLFNGGHRITQHHTQDMNGDGIDDIMATMFGDGFLNVGGGRFSIFWGTPEFDRLWKDAPEEIPAGPLAGALNETILKNITGTIGFGTGDFNSDGKPDIALLIAQGKQQLILLINQGGGKFTQQLINERQPSFGGNSLYVEDMNGDGHDDIVTVSGDFGTSFPFLGYTAPKPYNGVRIYRNNGDLTFSESYFYPMHGALRAAIEDFDGDGDMDIAAIAQYVMWEWDKPETFVYLENDSGLNFKPQAVADNDWSAWISIEAADVNADGKPDIVLGLANWSGIVPPDWKTRYVKNSDGNMPSITVLLNEH